MTQEALVHAVHFGFFDLRNNYLSLMEASEGTQLR